MPKSVQVHVFVSGIVQGVGYRAWTWEVATNLGLAGWVRNREDGQVEAVFEGAPALIEEMIQRCHQGPPAARVREVVVEAAEPEGLTEFQIKR